MQIQAEMAWPELNRLLIRSEQADVALEYRTCIITILQDKAVTVAIDGWTGINKAKVTNIVLLQGERAYYWTGFWDIDANDDEYVARTMEPILLELQQYTIRCGAHNG